MQEYVNVTILKTLPVIDRETLAAWLNPQLETWVETKRDGGAARATIGSKALDLIKEAGFELVPPTVTR